jgi:hypothetical protein
MKQCLLVLATTAVLGACATASPTQQTARAQVDNGDKTVVCDREVRVGSLIPSKHCAPPMTEAERQRMNDELRNKARSIGSSHGSGG